MRRCPNGHDVPDSVPRCPLCGAEPAARNPAATVYEEGPGPGAVPMPQAPFRPGVPFGGGPIGGGPIGGGRPAPAGRTVVDEEIQQIQRLMGWFLVTDSKQEQPGRFFRIFPGVNDIGRIGSRATIELRDEGVSERHAVLIATQSGYRLVDLDSRNGVLVNGAKTEHALLKHGDQIRLGYTTGTFVAFTLIAED